MNKPILQDPYQNGYKNEKHVVVRGTIAYKNTGGYLSADVKNFKGWSLLFVFVYGALVIYWINTIVKNQHSIIALQWYILAILMAVFFKNCLTFIYYFHQDRSNKRGGFLIFNITCLEILSSAFTHFIVLLVALGYKIVIKSIRKYHVKLALALFLYVITLAMKLITIYIRQDHKVSPAVNFITQFPVALINGVIFFWTVLAFKRTLSYL